MLRACSCPVFRLSIVNKSEMCTVQSPLVRQIMKQYRIAAMSEDLSSSTTAPIIPYSPDMADVLVNENHNIPEILTSLKKYGCVHIRSVFGPDEVRNAAQVVAAVRLDVANHIANNSLPTEISDGYVKRGSFCIKYLPDIVNVLVPMMKSSILPNLARELFQNPACWALGVSHLRCVEPENIKKYSPMHQDCFFLPGHSINICIPMTAYGGKCSGLSLMPGVRSAQSPEAVGALLADDAKTWVPEVLAGDVLIFDQFVPHHRHYGSNVTEERVNIEARFRSRTDVPEKCVPVVEF